MRTAAAAALVATIRLSVVANRLSAWAFQANIIPALPQRQHGCRRSSGSLLASTATPEETAQAMSEYLARTHEEKLKTAHEIREKDAEIEKLKNLLASAQEASPGISAALQHDLEPAPHAPVLAGARTEDLVSQIAAYQKFMSDYIVRAQEEKLRAVRNAEERVEKKYQEKMLLLTGGQAAPAAAAAAPTTAVSLSPETALYAGRSAKVEEAAKAGKSRWGAMEVGKASQFAANAGVTAVAAAASPPPAAAVAKPPPPAIRADEIPAEVIAADHGLRAGDLSLAERVLLGSEAPPAAVAPSASSAPGAASLATADTSLYTRRNAKVSEAAKAGKSRWGPMEVAKVTALAQAAPPMANNNMAPVVGGSGGGAPSLAERVNLGAQLVGR